ncbi:MAG: hypothetical protein QW794_00165 [Thermosphaera sp.]
MPSYVCSVCGKTFERGALIDGQVILCPDCAQEREIILAEIEYEVLKASFQRPEKAFEVLDKMLEEKKDKLAKFKTPLPLVKVRLARRFTAAQQMGRFPP